MRLKEKVAIITGAGRGIGEAIAYKFASEGAKVVVCDINEQDVNDTAEKIKEKGQEALAFKVDVTDTGNIYNMINEVCNKFGTVDILVNNAGITKDALFHKMSSKDWQDVINVNLNGIYNCTHKISKIMADKGSGKIINITSTSRFGNVGQANYSASKAGVVGFTRALAKELGSKGVCVNAIAPGTIDTDMYKKVPEKIKNMALMLTPLRRPGTVKELANLCLFLASSESSYITGQVINCDGGMYMC